MDQGATAGSVATPGGRRRRPAGAPPPTAAAATPCLEAALAAHLAAVPDHQLPARHLEALLDRLGLRGRPPCTLAEAGRTAGVSGERIRQIEARVRRVVAASHRPAPLPQLDLALAVVARALPLRASDVGPLLRHAGVTRSDFSAQSVEAAASLLGRPVPFVASGQEADALLLPRGAARAAAHARRMENRARRLAERCGATTLEELERELAGGGLAVPRRHLRAVLEACDSAVVRHDGWLWFTDGGDGPFWRATRRMLAVTDPLPLASLHEGLRRHNAFRHIPVLPPLPVLRAVYASTPGVLVAGDLVGSVEPVPEEAMGELNRRVVAILRAAPGHVMARSVLLEACHRAGLNLASVNLYTSYSECLERLGSGVLAPRGTVADEDAVRARQYRRRPGRRDKGAASGWTADGRPWIEARITASTWANGVLHVPADVRPILEGRHFATCDQAGARSSMVGADRYGNSWGWTGFLRRGQARPGDVVRAEFDLDAGVVRMVLARREPTIDPA